MKLSPGPPPPDFEKSMRPSGHEVTIPEFPDLDVDKRLFPTHDEHLLPKEALYPMYAGYMWYLYEGRYLLREEVAGVINMFFYKGKYGLRHTMFDRFEDPEHKLTEALERLEKESKEALKGRFVRWFKEFLNEHPAAARRARFFSLYPGRVNYPQVKTTTILDFKPLETYQLSTHYTMIHSYENDKKEKLSPGHAQKVLEQFYGFESPTDQQIRAVSQLTKKLQNPNHPVTVDVAKMNAGYDEYKKWIMRKVDEEVAKWEQKQTQAQTGQVIDPVLNVTNALGSYTLQTTSASDQPAHVEPRLQFPEDQVHGLRRQELLEQASREEKNKSEEGQREDRRRKRSQSPDARQHHRPKPPPPPPAAGQSHTPRSLPYDPARDS